MENVLIGCGLSHFHKICHEPIVHIMMGLVLQVVSTVILQAIFESNHYPRDQS